jgi:hypothetical protein
VEEQICCYGGWAHRRILCITTTTTTKENITTTANTATATAATTTTNNNNTNTATNTNCVSQLLDNQPFDEAHFVDDPEEIESQFTATPTQSRQSTRSE